ncbi:MAG: hypothetical protein HOO67_04420 [Candidatus Peribacteraceae bacterium]|nr:hypothetical protein [Candidatus Peribacteraceae bacterium]
MLQEYLSSLGFSQKESTIYLVLAEVGVQPASVIARRSNLDRVTAYKHLKKLADRGLVKVYSRGGVQCFGIESFDALESYIGERAQNLTDLRKRFPIIANVLKSLREGEDTIPRLQIFEGTSGIKALFRDMLHAVKQENVKQVRLLSSNTFEEWLSDDAMQRIVGGFFKDLKAQSVSVELFEVTGGLVPERLRKLSGKDISAPMTLVTHGSTNIFLIGHTVYLACYKGTQIGLKMTQAELSQIFHFLFDLAGRIKD